MCLFSRIPVTFTNKSEIDKYRTEKEFLNHGIKFLTELNECVKIISQIVPKHGYWNRNEAVSRHIQPI